MLDKNQLVDSIIIHLTVSSGEKDFLRICLKEWECIPLSQKECSFAKFKYNYKTVILEHYPKTLFKFNHIISTYFYLRNVLAELWK